MKLFISDTHFKSSNIANEIIFTHIRLNMHSNQNKAYKSIMIKNIITILKYEFNDISLHFSIFSSYL